MRSKLTSSNEISNTNPNSNSENIISNINRQTTPSQQNSINSNAIQNDGQEEEKDEFWVPLPYIGNISNKVGGYLRRKMKWKVTFTPGMNQHASKSKRQSKDKPSWSLFHSLRFM